MTIIIKLMSNFSGFTKPPNANPRKLQQLIRFLNFVKDHTLFFKLGFYCAVATTNSLPEVESSRTSLASRTSSRTHFEVLGLGLEGQVLGLGLEASSPRKLACPRLENSTIFWNAKFCGVLEKFFGKRFLVEIA